MFTRVTELGRQRRWPVRLAFVTLTKHSSSKAPLSKVHNSDAPLEARSRQI
jgi:hypothetical protein